MEGTIGEIRMFAGNFAPRSWAFCANQILPIAQNTALFSILGTTYGGNGQTTFALPDFRGRVAVGTGQGPGLPNITLGELAGSQTQALTINQMPAHNHALTGAVTPQANAGTDGQTDDPSGRRLMGASIFTGAATDLANMAAAVSTLQIGINGGSQPFSIMPPYLGMNYIICLFGIFPSRD
ncbi:MAG TPA: tail fiber protein [Chitinophagaceae bacterium]|jgi:microcystin-dependent protein|nr:tail fiber protein [Chitinophagaceae bacterium]